MAEDKMGGTRSTHGEKINIFNAFVRHLTKESQAWMGE
jgi:hypothetical protein